MFNSPVSCNRKDSLVSRGSFAVSGHKVGPQCKQVVNVPSNSIRPYYLCVKVTQAELKSRLVFFRREFTLEIESFGSSGRLAHPVLNSRTNFESFYNTTNLKD